MASILAREMREVVEFIAMQAKAVKGKDDVHQDIFHATAQRFEIYEGRPPMAPVWLSRVVEGVIRDVNNDEHDPAK